MRGEVCWGQAINPMEMAMEALCHMQTRFYKDFPPSSPSRPTPMHFGFSSASPSDHTAVRSSSGRPLQRRKQTLNPQHDDHQKAGGE